MQAVEVGRKRGGGKAEVHLADHVAVRDRMRPGADEELLPVARFARLALTAHAEEIADCPAEEDVMPTAQVIGRHGDVGVVGFDLPPVPIVVLVWVAEPIVVVWRTQAKERKGAEWSRTKPVVHLVHPGQDSPQIFGGLRIRLGLAHQRFRGEDRHDPTQVEPEGKCAPLISPAFVIVRRSQAGKDRLEVRRRRSGGQPLGGAEVGDAIHADVAVGPRLSRGPLDGVVAVGGLVEKRVESAF